MKYCMIETAFDNKEELNKTIKELLENKLVASCQVVESASKWNWHGQYEEAKEYLLFMKTKKELSEEIHKIISNIHGYDCFEFAIFELDSIDKEYLEWLETETR